MRVSYIADVMLAAIGSINNNMDATSKLCNGWWATAAKHQQCNRDDTKIECCGRVCSTRTQSSLRGSVSFCSIKCVLATKLGENDRIHEISITQRSFLEIPPGDDLIDY